jgi:hypothetical protein
MKARIRIDLPPGTVVSHDVRARIVSGVTAHLDVDDHAHCSHDLKKSDKPAPKLRYRAPQESIDKADKLYESMMQAMIDDIAAALAE